MAEVESPAATIEETIILGEEENGKRKRDDDPVGGEGATAEGDSVKKAKAGLEAGELEEEDVQKGEEEAELPAQSEKSDSVVQVALGPKKFVNAVELFSYFYKFMQLWPMNVNTNKYETMVLTELLLKGHTDPPSKIGPGIEAFQVQLHPTWQSRCYYVIRVDGSCEDFSYRKCCDNVLPLPAEYIANGRVCIELLNLGDFHKFKDLREEGYAEGSRGRGRGRGGGGGYRGGGGGRGGGKWGGGGSRGGRGGGNRGRGGRGGRGRW